MHPKRLLALLLAGLVLAPQLPAKPSTWKDLQGESFRAEPMQVLGPFAIFASGRSGKRMLLRGLPPEECVRFHHEVAKATAPGRRGEVTEDLVGRVLRVEDGKLVPVDLASRPEPEIYLALYASHNDGESWRMLNDFSPTYRRLRLLYGERIEAVFFGVRHKAAEHRTIALSTWQPWLVADFDKQSQLRELARFAPGEGISIVAMTARGAPLLATRAENVAAVRKFVDELGDFLRLLQPDDPRGWKDRLHYGMATQRIVHATDRAEPVLIVNPLAVDGLRDRGVQRVQASLEVGIDGVVTSATVVRRDGVDEVLARALTGALKDAFFVPAVERGQWIAATYDYDLEVSPADPARAAAAAWLGGEARQDIPLPSWLLLKPIRVPQQDIMAGSQVGIDDTVTMRPVLAVGKAGQVDRASQQSAFLTDWFASSGAGAVRPAEGDKLTIDEQDVTWKRVKSADGFVNFQDGLGQAEYSIGYAWTEFEVAADTPAWLGLGSDDGVKIWLNGELVHDQWIRRVSRLDDEIVPLQLKAGKNQLLIKIQNVAGDWSFIARLRAKS